MRTEIVYLIIMLHLYYQMFTNPAQKKVTSEEIRVNAILRAFWQS